MARTDDDSWDITESVGATALGVAMARAPKPVRSDRCSSTRTRSGSSMPPPRAAGSHRSAARGWRAARPRLRDGRADAAPSAAICGLRRVADQVLRRLLHRCRRQRASGRWSSSRPASMPAPGGCRGSSDTVVFEIDQPKVLRVQGRHPARRTARSPTARVRRRADRPAPGLADGVARGRVRRRPRPRRGSAEGLLPYLPASRPGPAVRAGSASSARPTAGSPSRRSAPSSSTRTTSADAASSMQEMRAASRRGEPRGRRRRPTCSTSRTRADVADWLTEHGWEVGSHRRRGLDGPVPPRTARRRRGHRAPTFVEGTPAHWSVSDHRRPAGTRSSRPRSRRHRAARRAARPPTGASSTEYRSA